MKKRIKILIFVTIYMNDKCLFFLSYFNNLKSVYKIILNDPRSDSIKERNSIKKSPETPSLPLNSKQHTNTLKIHKITVSFKLDESFYDTEKKKIVLS